jgi:alkaline phosphatase D
MSEITGRRNFLIRTGAWLGLTALGPIGRIAAAQRFSRNLFTLGVASGDPSSDGVVLWTRLAPDPLNGGGMPNQAIEVDYLVAEDEKLSRVAAKGKAIASPNLGHSVHVELNGLKPGRWYWYQFRAGGQESVIGRTRTAPAAASNGMRFAFASCQHYESGLYTAYQHMAEEDLDLVIHLGDYIYEGRPNPRVRSHNSAEIVSLDAYRNRYALYKLDEHLARTHARFPWLVTWDDHEVDNDYAGDSPEDSQTRQQFLERRANAYQAYYETMPLRRETMPKGSNMLLYRKVSFGAIADFFVLDTRQYRSDQPCGGGVSPLCPGALSPGQTILGAAQREWLFKQLRASKARWKVMAQQVPVGAIDVDPGSGQRFPMDKWNGYAAERSRLLELLREVANPVVITGDVHANWAMELKVKMEDARAVAAEFVGTSISSGGDGESLPDRVKAIFPDNPHVKYFNGQRGYVKCTLRADRWQSDYRIVPFVTKAGAPVQTAASLVVENEDPAIQKA